MTYHYFCIAFFFSTRQGQKQNGCRNESPTPAPSTGNVSALEDELFQRSRRARGIASSLSDGRTPSLPDLSGSSNETERCRAGRDMELHTFVTWCHAELAANVRRILPGELLWCAFCQPPFRCQADLGHRRVIKMTTMMIVIDSSTVP